VSWSCPSCSSPMARSSLERSEVEHCARCSLTYVSGDAVAALAARPDAFRAIISSAVSAPLSSRELSCPGCRSKSLHELRVHGVTVDICATCGGLILDPGEGKIVKRLASSPSSRVDAGIDMACVADGVAQIVASIAKPFL
jgi:Zn-finger nucleic acid-binding protein